MSTQNNVEVVKQAYENFKTGNIQSLLNLLSEDVTWRLPEMENVSYGGARSGREEVASFFTSLADSQEALQFEPREFVSSDDKVVALGRYDWRVKATGREYGGDWAHVFTVRDGKIYGFQEYMDTAAATLAHQKASAA
jgi:ketosteroid isomerase-like protein